VLRLLHDRTTAVSIKLNACFSKRSRAPPHYLLSARLAQLRDPMPKPMEGTMRRWFLAAAATLLTAAAITTAGALPLGPGAARPAVETINPVEQTACWRWGWRGWGWYPCWGAYHGGPYYYHHSRHPYGDEDDEDDEHEWHHHHWWR
jgi:hypothetical protein